VSGTVPRASNSVILSRLLRLYDRELQVRLTGEEAERAARERARAKLRELGIDPESL